MDQCHGKTLVSSTTLGVPKILKCQLSEAPSVRRALILSFGLVTLNQMCGSSAMVAYSVTIFEKAGSSLDSNLSAIMVGAIQTLGAYVGVLLVERSGRKVVW